MTRARRAAALLPLIGSALAAAAPPPAPVVLDRLFFSPDERRAMEHPRRPSIAPTPAPPGAPALPAVVRPERPIPLDSAGVPRPAAAEVNSVETPPPKMTGFVKRSSGNDTIWINQQPQYRRGE